MADYAVIELDRAVINRKPLPLRKKGFPLLGTELVVVGHPMGLPLKTADGGRVAFTNEEESETIKTLWSSLKLHKNYFLSSLQVS